MAMSLPQEQCPIQCQLCEEDPTVKWKCLDCDLLMCIRCKDKVHSKFKSEKEHKILDIKKMGRHDKTVNQNSKEIDHEWVSISGLQAAGVSSSPNNLKLTNIKEYPTEMIDINFMAVSFDGSLWIGDGTEKGSYTFTSLQNVQLVRDIVKIKSSFDMVLLDIAVTPTNDILIATGKPRLMQVKAGSSKVSKSIYCEDISRDIWKVYVSKDGSVIVGGSKFVAVMDAYGNHLSRYENDKNNKPILKERVYSITSTSNGNIFIVQFCNKRVIMLGKEEVINIYTGHPIYNPYADSFEPMSVVTTPMDNVIVADIGNHILHILDNNCQLLTAYNIRDVGIEYPASLAITMEGPFPVLYIGCQVCESISKTGKLYKMNIMEC